MAAGCSFCNGVGLTSSSLKQIEDEDSRIGLILNSSVVFAGFGLGLLLEFSDEEECRDFGGFTIGAGGLITALSYALGMTGKIGTIGMIATATGISFLSASELELLDAILLTLLRVYSSWSDF